ncbi:MAG: 4-hydroxy-2-oxovalerate aldolase [Candidatus Binatia bacterium]|nr:4-hydroxy-2-oxovalerate aldolase [Candidatus Binatia bacterium]
MMRVYITDVTLRDGDHAMAHQFSLQQIDAIARGLDAAGVDIVECSHGDGLAGSSIQYGMSREREEDILRTAATALTRARLAVLLLPGIGTKHDRKRAAQLGASVARIATHCTEADIAQQHIGLAKELGMRVVGFLMMAHMVPPATLAHQARLMESYGADCVYVVDSAGAMVTPEARERVRALRQALQCDVGFHAHNNLSLAVANSLAAIEEGATHIDASTCGLGAGAGNTQTEVLVAVLERLGYETGIDLSRLMDVAEELVRPIMPRPQIIDRDSLTIGYAGVYSTFLLHAKRAAKQFGVDSRALLAELGRRKMVGGQEDMIIDVAVEMAEARQRAGNTAVS